MKVPVKSNKNSKKPLMVAGVVAVTAVTLPVLSLVGLNQQTPNDQLQVLQDEQDVQAVIQEFSNLNQTVTIEDQMLAKFMPQTIVDHQIQDNPEQFNIKLPNDIRKTILNYQIIERNDDFGHIDVKLTAKKNQARGEHKFKIINFVTSQTRDKNDVHFAKYLIEKNLHNKAVSSNSIYKDLLPSHFKEIVQIKKSRQNNQQKTVINDQLKHQHLIDLGLKVPTIVDHYDNVERDEETNEIMSHLANVDYFINDHDDIYGTLTLQVAMRKNQAQDQTTIILRGFKRLNEHD